MEDKKGSFSNIKVRENMVKVDAKEDGILEIQGEIGGGKVKCEVLANSKD